MSEFKTKDIIIVQWNGGTSLDNITSILKASGKTLRNGKFLSKTHVKGMIQTLIQRGKLNKRTVAIKKEF